MRETLTRWLLLAVLAFGAGWIRTRELARRPMHADEANQAVKTGELLEHGRYTFDPRDHHGPTLYYAALPIAWARGERTLATLTETTVRLVPVIFGIATVLLIAVLAEPLGRWPSFAAGAFAALSPTLVYFSRYFVQETLLLAFTLATFVSAWRWWTTGARRWALAAGASIGLMAATKGNAAIFLVGALVALLATRLVGDAASSPRGSGERGGDAASPANSKPAGLGRALALAALAAVVVAGAFYSSFGTNFAGLRDALVAPFQALGRVGGGASGHEKPFGYYVQLFIWQRGAGVIWQQLALCGLAFVGVGLAFWPRGRLARLRPNAGATPAHSGLLRGAAVYTLFVGLVLSLTPYKTPWHAIHLVPGLCVLAAGALAALAQLPTGRWVALLFAAFTGVMLAGQTRLAAFTYAADARNPLAYVHSSPDVAKVRALAADARAKFPGQPVRVIGDEYWPLPWYLRGLPDVGYWTTPPADCDGALVIASPSAVAGVRARLRGRYRESFFGLRPGVICLVFTREP